MLMAGTLGIMSLLFDRLWRWLGGGSKTLWDLVILILVAELAVTVEVTKIAHSASKGIKPDGVNSATLYLFAFMAIPQAVGMAGNLRDFILTNSNGVQVQESTFGVERKLEGTGPWSLWPDIELIHTPGHTEGSVCLYHKPLKVLFTGRSSSLVGF
ncbi:hypothetical protein Droror1_Dr00011772 [Drosera rotundifolia]